MSAKAELRKLAAERATLVDPIDRIAFDNRWVDGVPVGLSLMALAQHDRCVAEIAEIAETFKVDVWEMVLIATGAEPTSETDPLADLTFRQVDAVLARMRSIRAEAS